MAIHRIRYRTLEELLAHEPIARENPGTEDIIRRLAHVRFDGRLSRAEFLAMCHWKSPRSIGKCRRNRGSAIAKTAGKVFAARGEQRKLELLTGLHGVSVPTASAILTLTNPRRYGVIDIRVWQLLYALGSVSTNADGQGFTSSHWLQYLRILRHQARRLRIPVRLVELTLFQFHRGHQAGTLYRRRRSASSR